MISLCKLGTELWGKGQSFGGDPQQDRERERDGDRGEGERQEVWERGRYSLWERM